MALQLIVLLSSSLLLAVASWHDIDKLLTVTVDNASSNSVTISYLKNVMKDWSTNILSNEHLHVRCCAHIVNLIVCCV